jgi:DNA-binding transcriptional LysR family regulator
MFLKVEKLKTQSGLEQGRGWAIVPESAARADADQRLLSAVFSAPKFQSEKNSKFL